MSSKQNQEPEEVQVNGKILNCVVCSNRQFWIRSAQLNTAVSTFFGFDWTDHSATCFICSECTYVHWFLGK
jgi:hypothetical protein